MKDYELELDKVIIELKRSGAKEITLQFPEGLKTRAIEIAKKFKDFDVSITVDPCYGACDLAPGKHVVHFGHADMGHGDAIYVPMYDKRNPLPVIKKAIPKLKGKIGIVTTIQHVKWLPKIEELLEEENLEVAIGRGTGTKGQVLGCEWGAATGVKADMYLYIGSGKFHPVGVEIATGKQVIVADPLTREVRTVEREVQRYWTKRAIALDKAHRAKVFGILMSTKPGQNRSALARNLKKKIEGAGKEAVIIVGNELNPANLMGIRVDCLVNTACPRILDDSSNYKQTLIGPEELEVVLGKKSWDELRKA